MYRAGRYCNFRSVEFTMTVASFRRCVALKSVNEAERIWLIKWLAGYAKFHGMESENSYSPIDTKHVDDSLSV